MIPGQIIPRDEPVELNPGPEPIFIDIENTGDLPVHLTAHFHVFEANPRMRFNRLKAWGMRLDVPTNGSVRFEPGQTQTVALIPIGGARNVYGFNDAVNGNLDEVDPQAALDKLIAKGFLHTD